MKIFLSNLETLKACTEEDLGETVKKLLEQCPCNDCFFNDCDYWDSKYCCKYCRWLHGEVTPNCEDCNPMDI